MDSIDNGIFEEPFFDRPYELVSGYKIKEVLYQGHSAYQDILVLESQNHGRILALDGYVQLSEYDEFSYHEMLSFTALSCHEDPKEVLIVGGGDGGMAREVLKFPTVESVTVCDIDEEVVNVCKRYLPSLSKSFDHPKVNLVIADAFEFLQKHNKKYDVIICDCTDPDANEGNGPSARLFGGTFYDLLKASLKKNGIVCAQNGSNMWQCMEDTMELLHICKKRFPKTTCSYVSVPSFACAQNGFILCSLDKNLQFEQPKWKFNEHELDKMGLKFYNTDLHRCSFALPRFVKKQLHGIPLPLGKALGKLLNMPRIKIYPFPPTVPADAKKVLLFVTSHSKYNPGHNLAARYRFFTKGGYKFSKYMGVHYFAHLHTTSNSQNIWLPVTSDRLVRASYFVPKAKRHLLSYLIGYIA